MSRKYRVLGALVTTVAVVVVVLRFIPSGPKPMTVEFTGTEGVRLQGTYTADGIERAFSGRMPTNIAVEAKHLKYAVRMSDEGGELGGKLLVDGVDLGSSRTSTSLGGVAGEFRDSSSLIHVDVQFHFTTLRKNVD